MHNQKNVALSLRSIGKSINCIPSISGNSNHTDENKNGILNISRIDIESADSMAEKIMDSDGFENSFFLSPLLSHMMIKNDDTDGDEYWGRMKPILIDRFSKTFGWRYGIDYAILRRGFFSIIAFFFKNKKCEWDLPIKYLDYVLPDSSNVFLKTIDYYYKDTDLNFFPINAITAINKNSDGTDYSIEKKSRITLEGIQVDISFLRSESFMEYDFNDGRTHHTKNIFIEGMMHSLAIEHRILSFDEELIDSILGDLSETVCYRRDDGSKC